MPFSPPRLTLAGAGPGDADLVTIKCIKAIQTADVILYDKLVNFSLLELAREGAEKIYVGKLPGADCRAQEQINALIVQKALEKGHVLRLKGGDPFVFGRGFEEMEVARKAGIPVDVIPGVSSSISLAGLKQIPLTARGYSESIWITTGTTRQGTLSEDILWAARSTATIVILMGMHRLEEILSVFLQAGKSDTPIAIIQNGSLPDEKMAIGTIATILPIVREQAMKSPAVIIIGEVVRLNDPGNLVCHSSTLLPPPAAE